MVVAQRFAGWFTRVRNFEEALGLLPRTAAELFAGSRDADERPEIL